MKPFSASTYEQRPRDFGARFSRRRVKTIGMRGRRKHRGRRAMVLLAAVAVPAFAAPEEWRGFDIGNAGRAELVLQPMPFEKPGDSFPGSAFYYLAPDEPVAAPVLADGAQWDSADAPTVIDPVAGPVARALRVDNSGVDRSRALECLTAAIYYEAASEPDGGQRAVAQVILNRVAHASFPNTVCGVVYQGSERSTGCQFSFTCDGSLARRPSAFFWERARQVASAALAGYVYAPVGLATHYHTFAVHPAWDAKMINVTNIGAHRFFRMPGPAGEPGAYRFAYLGGEPVAAPHPHSNAPVIDAALALDPLAIQRAYEAGLKAAQANGGTALAPTTAGLAPVHAAPAPTYTSEQQQRGGDAVYRGEKLPEATGIRPEYQNSGRWIAQPGAPQ
ncbi:MAG: cell wall hydrolase [Sphingomonadales bacterium]|nr:cell wall hydrolase [Sphingomonadales bacterium]